MVEDARSYFEAAVTVESPRVTINGFYPCPCCGDMSFSEAGGWEICSRCDWEDDPVQERHPDLRGGANKPSLIEARANFVRHGHSDPEGREQSRQFLNELERRDVKPKLP